MELSDTSVRPGEVSDNLQQNDLLREAGGSIQNYIKESLSPWHVSDFLWLDTKYDFELPLSAGTHKGLVNLHRINDVQRINKFLEKINRSLDYDNYLVISMETKDARKMRILSKFPKVISRPYYVLDFIVKRVFPKWSFTKKLYFWLTKGRNRVLSLTEGMGRLTSCGFEIVDYQQVGYTTWITSRKISDPVYDMQPTYGPLCKLKRIGKDGKMFSVYKLRTMHPYSEYIQDFVFKKNDLEKGGKLKDDFRITRWGRIFRKLWIDELPMLYNWLRGEMKLVGVRPLSKHYFNLYPEELQTLRTRVKPGLLPPFYADLPETLDEIVESERVYLTSYLEKPIRTDIRYFFKAMYNIFIKRARSA